MIGLISLIALALVGCATGSNTYDGPSTHVFQETFIVMDGVDGNVLDRIVRLGDPVPEDECEEQLEDFIVEDAILAEAVSLRPALITQTDIGSPEDRGHVWEFNLWRNGKVIRHLILILDCAPIEQAPLEGNLPTTIGLISSHKSPSDFAMAMLH